jgi:hypothetical protein
MISAYYKEEVNRDIFDCHDRGEDRVGENPGNEDPDPETSSGYQSKKISNFISKRKISSLLKKHFF